MDYIELYVQWGFLTLFGSAFPLVVVFALLTNYAETRTDGLQVRAAAKASNARHQTHPSTHPSTPNAPLIEESSPSTDQQFHRLVVH